jgi:hypothetical protein
MNINNLVLLYSTVLTDIDVTVAVINICEYHMPKRSAIFLINAPAFLGTIRTRIIMIHTSIWLNPSDMIGDYVLYLVPPSMII